MTGQFDAAYYEELQGKVRGLLVLVSSQLPAVTNETLDDLIDANESGIALEMMSEMLVESGASLSAPIVADFAALAERMGLSAEVAGRLVPLITEGPTV